MARFELGDINSASLGEAPAADSFYELGMMYSIGRSVPVDYVTAHKWFNLAALRGNGRPPGCAARSRTRCRRRRLVSPISDRHTPPPFKMPMESLLEGVFCPDRSPGFLFKRTEPAIFTDMEKVFLHVGCD